MTNEQVPFKFEVGDVVADANGELRVMGSSWSSGMITAMVKVSDVDDPGREECWVDIDQDNLTLVRTYKDDVLARLKQIANDNRGEVSDEQFDEVLLCDDDYHIGEMISWMAGFNDWERRQNGFYWGLWE